MQKRIVLLLIFMVLNLNIYSQVVIRDEIVLDETTLNIDGTESTGIIKPMPFYGKIYSEIPCQWNHWTTGWIRKHRAAANQVWDTGCWGASCPGQCFCSWPSTDGWWFYDVPALTDFVINIQRCYNGQLLDVPLSYEYIGNDKYNLYGVDLSDGSIDYIGFFKFYPTTPPGCDNGEPCTDPEFKVPGLKPKPVDYSTIFPQGDPCVDQNLLSGTIPVYTKNEFLENYSLEACFNLQTQKWQFVVDNNNVLQPRIIKEICENNIANKDILLADSLDGVDPNYPCKQVVEDINSFYRYGWWQPDGYLFKKLLLGHEQLHVESYNADLQEFYDLFEEEYKNLLALFPCEHFGTTAQAEAYANIVIRDVTYKWSFIAIQADPIFGFWYHPYTDITKGDLEQALHIRMYGTITSWWIEAISNCNN